jgi:hypothetical protein
LPVTERSADYYNSIFDNEEDRTPLLEGEYHVKETEEGKFALKTGWVYQETDMEEMGHQPIWKSE